MKKKQEQIPFLLNFPRINLENKTKNMKCLTKKTYIINRNFIYQEKSSRNTEINTSEYEGLTISELKNAKRKIIIDNFEELFLLLIRFKTYI